MHHIGSWGKTVRDRLVPTLGGRLASHAHYLKERGFLEKVRIKMSLNLNHRSYQNGIHVFAWYITFDRCRPKRDWPKVIELSGTTLLLNSLFRFLTDKASPCKNASFFSFSIVIWEETNSLHLNNILFTELNIGHYSIISSSGFTVFSTIYSIQ